MLSVWAETSIPPSLIAPNDPKVVHDIYVAKVNRQRIKEQREKERQQAIKDKAKFEELQIPLLRNGND